MESTASDDIIGCMFVLVDDVAMAGGGGGGCGILGHFFHFWILILDFGDLDFGFWDLGCLGELFLAGGQTIHAYAWHRFGGSS